MKEWMMFQIQIMLLAIIICNVGVSVAICKRLDKLIELNTPEFINVIPDKMIIEKH